MSIFTNLTLVVQHGEKLVYVPQSVGRGCHEHVTLPWHAGIKATISRTRYTLWVLRKVERELPNACVPPVLCADRKVRYRRLYEQMAHYARAESSPFAAAGYVLRVAAWNPLRTANNVIPDSVRSRAAWYWSRLRKVGYSRNYGKTFRHGWIGTEISREDGALLRRLDGTANSCFSFLGLGLATNS